MWGIFSAFKGYDAEWKEIEKIKYEKPETALKLVDTIEKKAKHEANYPQQLRCIVSRYQLSEQKDDDAFVSCLKEFKQFRSSQKDKVALSVASYMESMAYFGFYQSNRWKINQRTNLADSIPDDIEEWTSNIFLDKIRELRRQALAELAIRDVPATNYEPLLDLQKDSRTYRPTLFDLMAHHAIVTSTVASYEVFTKSERLSMLRELVKFHENDKDSHAYVMAQLDLLEFENEEHGAEYVRRLQEMLKMFEKDPSSVLVRIELANEKFNSMRNALNPTPTEEVMQICKEGIDKFPNHPNISCLKNIIREMKQRSHRVHLSKSVLHEGDPLMLKVSYANITKIEMDIYRYDVSAIEWQTKDHTKQKKSKIASYSYNLDKTDYCLEKDTMIEIPALPLGAYCLSVGDKDFNFVVSNLFYIQSRSLVNDGKEFVMVDSKSGAPEKDVKVALYRSVNGKEYEIVKSALSDKNGFAKIVEAQRRHFNSMFMKGEDVYLPSSYSYYGEAGFSSSDNAADCYVSVFTDRSIYRPGQTVHYKFIAYRLGEDKSEVKTGEPLKVIVYDGNLQKIDEKNLTTNEFGSAASSFVIPSTGLAGRYTISVSNGGRGSNRTTFRVEEYKRPTFEVNLSRPSGTFTFGDTVVVKGRADYLLGTAVTDAKVSYKITRKENPWFWWWNSGKQDEIVADGEVMTNEHGDYEIPFVPKKDDDVKGDACYVYQVEASVTDPNGETQQQSVNFSVGDKQIAISCPSHKRYQMDKLSEVRFSVLSLNYEGISKEVSYIVYRDDKEILSNKVMSDPKDGFHVSDDTNQWTPGKYKIVFTAVDDRGVAVSQTFETILYRADDKRPPVESDLWVESDGTYSVVKGEKKSIRIGTTLKKAHLLLILSDQNSVVKKEWYTLSDEIKTFEFSLSNEELLNAEFFLVQDQHLKTATLRLNKKIEYNEVPVKLSVFRDKMLPGSEEKWTLTLPADKAFEVLAAMYDASLDQIERHDWSFYPHYDKYYRIPQWYAHDFGSVGLSYSEWLKDCYTRPSWTFDGWNFYFQRIDRFQHHRVYKSLVGGAVNSYSLTTAEESVVMDESVDTYYSVPQMASSKKTARTVNIESYSENDSANEPMKVRTNFAETAFFYPSLTADKDGNVHVTFTMPESLTRWKFMALAHSKDLFYGMLTKEVVTQKEFMISPNLPRFIRKGDQCVLSAKIMNLSDEPRKGSAKLQFLDPVSETVIVEKITDFSVGAGENTVANWSLEIPREMDAVLVRTSAISGSFSDAEQKLLPILSDRVVLTQSMPVVVRGGATKDYSFDNLVNNTSKSLISKFLKLEMATNPVWYAVQALPSVAVVEHDNVISYSAAHFASSMAQMLAQSNPRIFKVIELWKSQSADKTTLLSNLEKNQEVKNVLLNECPWVMDAKNETEMKQRLTTLFDVNDLRSKCDTWLKKIKDLQNTDGGYAWFKDMPSGFHTSLFVVDNFGRLRKAGLDVSAVSDELNKALLYLDNQLREHLEHLKKYDKDYKKHAHVGMSELYYYQVRSLFPDVKVDKNCQEAYDFFYNLVKKQWLDFSLYGKSLAAISLYRHGDKDEAKRIVRSLREFSSTSEEMGMYWKKNVSGYLWEDAAISTHTRIMEAFEEIDPISSELDEMRVWLLNQKRTQNWDNTIANIDALNVLLLSGSDWLSNDNKVSVRMGDQLVEPKDTEAGTGYYTVVVPGNEVTPKMGKVQLQSAAGGNISWGALYWQFEEDIDAVKSNKAGLHIEKMVMVEKVQDGKNVLKTVDKNSELRVGDKIVVRLTLRTDRDLDYVTLKDQRAGCLEPLQQLSGYRCAEYTCYYQSAKDAAMYYFFSHLQKGTYVFEYPMWVTNEGDYSNGITTVQCLYAPEFSSNTGSVRIRVNR